MKDKEHLYKCIYPAFLNTTLAYYLSHGNEGSEIFKYALETLKEQAKKLNLSAGVIRTGGDLIFYVEKPEEYTLVSTRLSLYTFEDEEE